MPSQKLVHKFKNPNPNSNNNENYEEWIELWTFNENNLDQIKLGPKVILDSDSLINENRLINKILNASNNFWKPVTQNNVGYVPKTVTNAFLYADANGNPQWITPTYDKVTYSENVTVEVNKPATNNGIVLNGIKDNKGNQITPPILTNNGQSTTDYILDLNNFLWNNISATITGTTTSTPLTVTTTA